LAPPYENTEDQWNDLCEAAKKARYLDLVPADAFVDRRNPEPIFIEPTFSEALTGIVRPEDWEWDVPDFPDLPSLELDPPTPDRPYEVWLVCEKSTVNDILLRLQERYGVGIITGEGQLSITRALYLVNRAIETGRALRILYICDFDPEGDSMPVAFARKIEFELRKRDADADVVLKHVALTKDQVQDLDLPRIPIKDTDRKKTHFEDRHGEGAVELDALEAIHPGELESMLVEEIEHYWDTELQEETDAVASEVREQLNEINNDVHGRHRDAYEAQRERYAAEVAAFQAAVAPIRQELETLSAAVESELRDRHRNLDPVDWPQSADAGEIDDPNIPDPLYDSQRNYETQIRCYKTFQGKPFENERRTEATELRDRILALHAQGLNGKEIARELKRADSYVYRVIKFGGKPPRLPHRKATKSRGQSRRAKR
jgi:hypothetical protein